MIKKQFLLLLTLISFLFLPLSCDWADGGVEIIDETSGEDLLVDMVFAGEDSAHNWITVAFRPESSAACFFAHETTGDIYAHANYTYNYDKSTGGSIIGTADTEAGGSDFTPGTFTLQENNSKLVFDDTGLTLFRVRDSNAVDLPVPFTVSPLPVSGSLDGTVWAATGFRTKDWTTLSIISSDGTPHAGTITVSHSFDTSSLNRAYTDYDPATGVGTLEYIGAFKIESDTFTFLNFYGHGGAVPFKRMR
ncbi:MAG: hypothetical protein LBQ88_07735 [Treponema sp.]|jgi:hypothetical protein|nr:hypothetical protein [Treponema sp.]